MPDSYAVVLDDKDAATGERFLVLSHRSDEQHCLILRAIIGLRPQEHDGW
jgi:hypothetical protein